MKKLLLAFVMFISVQLNASVFDWHLETIIGYTIERNGIVFQVYDGGCTQPKDFSVIVEKNNSDVTYVTLFRKKEDPCEVFLPYGQKVKFSFNKMGISKNEAFEIRNPINPGFVRY